MQVHAWELRKTTEKAEIMKEVWDKPPNLETTLGFSHSPLPPPPRFPVHEKKCNVFLVCSVC